MAATAKKQKTKTSKPILPSEILTNILLCLPSQALIRLTLVSHSFSRLILSPLFASLRPSSPLSGLFANSRGRPLFLPLDPTGGGGPAPSASALLFSYRFEVAASSHGLLLFRRGRQRLRDDLLLCHPLTRHWAVLPKPRSPSSPPSPPSQSSIVLIYASSSPNFTVVRIERTWSTDEDRIRFHVFCSASWSWRAPPSDLLPAPQPPYRAWWDQMERDFDAFPAPPKAPPERPNYSPPGSTDYVGAAGIAEGGTVCWRDENRDFLMGFDVAAAAADSCWKIPLPMPLREGRSYVTERVVGCGGRVYLSRIADERVEVWRLEDRERWALEGEDDVGDVRRRYSSAVKCLAYDAVGRTVVLMGRAEGSGGRTDLVVYQLGKSRWEVGCENVGSLYDDCVFPHYSTLDDFDSGGAEVAGRGFQTDDLQRFLLE